MGLSLRRHPIEFLRVNLTERRIVTCAEAMAAAAGRWLEAAGLVLYRQRPGSAKGVMFITIEDETGVANLVVWLSLFERQRRIVLSAGLMAAHGKIQRECAWSISSPIILLICRKTLPASASATANFRAWARRPNQGRRKPLAGSA